jgi:hypothetical protein
MAKKKVDLKAAKAAKQKKIVIVGGVLFIALLAFQVPRTMKMLHPKHSAAPTRTEYSASAPPATTPAATGAPTTSVSNTSASTTVLTAQLAPAAREGQLAVLTAAFKSKDPFRQLIKEDDGASASTASASTATPAKSDVTLKVVPNAKTEPATPASPAAPATPDGKKIALPFLSAVISVNGVKEGVNVKLDFPAEAPVFHLVSLTNKTAKISVAGGSLAGGSNTLTLRRGKALTLVNTADGTRYRLVLVTTSRAAAVAQTQDSGSTTPTTAPTSTTPATTTPTTTTPTIGG